MRFGLFRCIGRQQIDSKTQNGGEEPLLESFCELRNIICIFSHAVYIYY